MVNVKRNSITEDDHQQNRSEHGEGQSHRVMLQLNRFAARECPDAAETEAARCLLTVNLRTTYLGRLGRCRGRDRFFGRLLEVADKSIFQVLCFALGDELCWRTLGQ